MPDPIRVVILGGGFAGLECAKGLDDPAFDVTLVDRQNHHLFQPLLYQVATAGLSAPEIAQPLRHILSGQRNTKVLMDSVASVDLAGRRVILEEHGELPYDQLVIALGARTGYFGHPEWSRHAGGLKTLDDAMRIRREVLSAFERAEWTADPEERARLTTIAIVGGGPTGVELAGAFAELSRVVFSGEFRRLDPAQARILLIEAAPRLLMPFDETLSHYTEQKLRRMGVEVRTGATVEEVGPEYLRVAGEEIRAATILWAAGVEAVSQTRDLGVPLDRGGRIQVLADLSVSGHPEVFAAGDIAACRDACGVNVPALCPAAMQMGKHVASVIREVAGRRRRGAVEQSPGERAAFSYRDKGIMATIGRSAAVASSKGFKMTGFTAWLAWLLVHLLFLVGFKNKVSVVLQWFYSYAVFKRASRIITGRG
ncbi:MAG: NAD(P)/FAD-dependent oxidoreductase [Verrucomicrobiales bacterium]